MKDRPHPGWPSTGCAHGSAHWPGRPPARSWCAAGRAPAPIGPRRVACAPRPPAAAVSLDRTSMRPNPPHSQVTTDELLGLVARPSAHAVQPPHARGGTEVPAATVGTAMAMAAAMVDSRNAVHPGLVAGTAIAVPPHRYGE